MIPVQSRTIEFDWLKLANALEELEPSQSGKLQNLISKRITIERSRKSLLANFFRNFSEKNDSVENFARHLLASITKIAR